MLTTEREPRDSLPPDGPVAWIDRLVTDTPGPDAPSPERAVCPRSAVSSEHVDNRTCEVPRKYPYETTLTVNDHDCRHREARPVGNADDGPANPGPAATAIPERRCVEGEICRERSRRTGDDATEKNPEWPRWGRVG